MDASVSVYSCGKLPGATPEEVFQSIEAEAGELGFPYCSHWLRMPLPITRPYTLLFSNYPTEWQSRYKEKGYLQVDPSIMHGMRSSEPVVWSDALFAKTPQLWAEAQAHGLVNVWSQSRRDPEGTFSFLVLARPSGAIDATELAEAEWRMQRLVDASHTSMKARCKVPELMRPDVGLSDREIDVLRWTADGKTASEIADILFISERTVNFHINRIVCKLGACNKINAAVRAAMLGLVW